MLCPKCGKENKNNAKYCMYCGKKIIKEISSTFIFCSNCGKKNSSKDKYCSNCCEKLREDKTKIKDYTQSKNGVGFMLGLLLGIIGLIIGLCLYPFGSNSRKTFLNLWSLGFFVWICDLIIFIATILGTSSH